MLLSNLDVLATAPGGVARLRELILTLAVQGKLVPQDPADEPASVLLQRVANQKVARSTKAAKTENESYASAAPYELPQNWVWTRLGDVVENMGSGWSPACEEGERTDATKWAVLRTTAVQLNEYRPHEHKVIPSKLTPRPEIEVKNGDVLITRAGPLNRVGISCWVNDTPSRLMLSDKIVRFHAVADEMLPAFIVLTLNAGWTKSQIESAKTGMAASQVNISQTDLKALWLPVCSKAEQSRIVTRVEELMRLCDALQAKGQMEAAQHAQLVSTLLGTLTASATPEELADHWQRVAQHFDLLLDRPAAIDALEQTLLQLAVRGLLVPQDPTDEPASALLQRIRAEKDRLIATGQIKRDKPLPPIAEDEPLFTLPRGWEWVRFGQIANIASNLVSPALHAKKWQVAPDCIEKATGRLLHRRTVAQAEIISPNHLFKPGQILYSKIRPSLSKAVLVDFEGLCSADMYPIESPLDSEYLLMYILSQPFLEQVSIAENRVKMPKLNQEALVAITVALPPLPEQSRIVTRVTALRRLCADLRQRLAERQSVQARLAEALVDSVA